MMCGRDLYRRCWRRGLIQRLQYGHSDKRCRRRWPVRCGAVRQRVLVIIFWLSELTTNWRRRRCRHVDATGTGRRWRTAVWPGFHRVIARRCTLMTTWLQWSPLVSPLTSFWHLHLVASLKHASYERACLVYVLNTTTLDHKIIRPTSKWENRDISFKAFSPSEALDVLQFLIENCGLWHIDSNYWLFCCKFVQVPNYTVSGKKSNPLYALSLTPANNARF